LNASKGFARFLNIISSFFLELPHASACPEVIDFMKYYKKRINFTKTTFVAADFRLLYTVKYPDSPFFPATQ